MHESDRRTAEVARQQRNLVTRADLLAAGGSDSLIQTRRENARLVVVQAGVYTTAHAPLSWEGKLLAACLAAGSGTGASHRAAFVVWAIDGLRSAPLEVIVPYTHGPCPEGVIVHRTRRPVPLTVVDGIPVTTIERTLLDGASCLSPRVVEKGLESAIRKGLTTARKVECFIEEQGGRGVRGTRALRAILEGRPSGGPAGSGAEVEFWRAIAGLVPPPERQHRLDLGNGEVAVVDAAWPALQRAIEIDGADAHGAEALDGDLDRQNRILDAGWDLRRFSGRRVRRDPAGVAAQVARFVNAPVTGLRRVL